LPKGFLSLFRNHVFFFSFFFTFLAQTEMSESTITLNLGTSSVTMPVGHFIGNKFVKSVSASTTSKLINPFSEDLLCELPMGDGNDVDSAVAAAHAAFEAKCVARVTFYAVSNTDVNGREWAGLPAHERGRLLYKLADAIEANRDTIARIESINVGKVVSESFNYDLAQVIRVWRYFAGYADKYFGKQASISDDVVAYISHVPLGVVGMIMPWNFPLQLLCWKLAPAVRSCSHVSPCVHSRFPSLCQLCVGNTVVIKPAEITPLSTLFLVKLMREVGFPAGVVNVVLGKGSTIGMAMCRHTGIEKIGFTGSTDVGRLVQAAAAEVRPRPGLDRFPDAWAFAVRRNGSSPCRWNWAARAPSSCLTTWPTLTSASPTATTRCSGTPASAAPPAAASSSRQGPHVPNPSLPKR
jgi:hypothetical protein